MYIASIHSALDTYVATANCQTNTSIGELKKYASLWVKVPSKDLALHLIGEEDKPLPDYLTLDEQSMKKDEGGRRIVFLQAAYPFKIDDHPIRHNARIARTRKAR
ncbi:hypothetical protein IWW52_000526 [Coemansia sp. RSA 2704]|nr:hypothetical protein IWW54_001057 [Coemansia sp. RSA 2705]KAJ2321788.1 hypothetical protein IWW52_000526 [Coemansia sp. RSA 2704]